MKSTKSRFAKNVELTLPPGDVGPLCTYSPNCSPSDRNLGVWRKAHIRMREDNLEDLTRDEETELINTWILQLLRRELTLNLAAAEAKLRRPLEIRIGARAAEVVRTALALRVPPPEPRKKFN
jgi:hypothetical protein